MNIESAFRLARSQCWIRGNCYLLNTEDAVQQAVVDCWCYWHNYNPDHQNPEQFMLMSFHGTFKRLLTKATRAKRTGSVSLVDDVVEDFRIPPSGRYKDSKNGNRRDAAYHERLRVRNEKIKAMHKAGQTPIQIADELGMKPDTVRHAITRKLKTPPPS